mgnify:CR=1 FL=1
MIPYPQLAKEYLQRTPGLEDDALGAVVARWGARLSALLIRGNGAVVRAGGPPLAVSPHVDIIGNPGLHDLVIVHTSSSCRKRGEWGEGATSSSSSPPSSP